MSDPSQALLRAAGKKLLPALERALAAGADVEARDDGGATPLLASVGYERAERRTPKLVKALLAAGADPEAAFEAGRTALHAAAQYGFTQTVELLLAAGANPSAQDRVGLTPLHQAVRLPENAGVVKLLIAAGADPNAATHTNFDLPAGATPLDQLEVSMHCDDAYSAKELAGYAAIREALSETGGRNVTWPEQVAQASPGEEQPAFSVQHKAIGICNVDAIAVHPQRSLLVTGGDDGAVVCWELPQQTVLWRAGVPGEVHALQFNAAGDTLLVASGGVEGLQLLRTEDGSPLAKHARRDGRRAGFSAAGVDPQGQVAAGVSLVLKIEVLAPPRLRFVREHPVACTLILFAGGRAVTSAGSEARVWSAPGADAFGSPASWILEHGDASIKDVAVAPGGAACATAATDGCLRVWALEPGVPSRAPTFELDLCSKVYAVAYSTDGTWLVVGDGNGQVSWLDARSHRVVKVHTVCLGSVDRLEFTPGSAWLVAAGSGRASLWAPPE